MDFAVDGCDRYRTLQHIDFTADGRDRYRTLQYMDFTADGRDRYRTLQYMDFTADGRDRYRTLQHMDFTADGRDHLKTSLLQILQILLTFRILSQLDANAERLQLFSTLCWFRAVAIVAVAFIRNNIRPH